MSRFNKDVIRYNEREISKSFSEKSFLGKIAAVFSVLVLLFAIVSMLYILAPENTDYTDYTGEADLTAFESETTAVIEESLFAQ